MEKFAFVMHPLSARRDVSRKYPFVRFLPESWVESGIRHVGPMLVSKITGLRSLTGAEAEGWFVGCALTPRQLLSLPIEEVWRKIIATVNLAEELGARIVGLGAFTSIVGDGGITVAKNVGIPVTTGNSYTVATAIEGAVKAAGLMGIDPLQAHIAVVGATGSIGKTCAQAFARMSPVMTLVGRSTERLEVFAKDLRDGSSADVRVTTDVEAGIANADIVIAVSSAIDAIIEPRFIKPGAVICDVARPRDVSVRVVKERNDVLVIEGGVVEVPGDTDFHFNFGFPEHTAYACMSETMMLALDAKYENFSLGKEVTLAQVDETSALALKHGFKLAGLRSFEKAVTPEQIESVRRNAGR